MALNTSLAAQNTQLAQQLLNRQLKYYEHTAAKEGFDGFGAGVFSGLVAAAHGGSPSGTTLDTMS